MGLIQWKRPWDSQPQEVVGVNPAGPFGTADVGDLWVPQSTQGLLTGRPLTNVSTGVERTAGVHGIGFTTSGQTINAGGAGKGLDTGFAYGKSTSQITFFCLFESFDAVSAAGYGGPIGDDVVQFQYHHGSAPFQNTFVVRAASGAYAKAKFSTPAANTPVVWVGTYDGATVRAYTNGVLTGTAATISGATYATSASNTKINTRGSNYPWNGRVYVVGAQQRAWSAEEVAYYSDRVWETLEPQPIWVPVSAGGGVTGTLATTNADDTSAASGTTTVIGTSAPTNANDTSAASGTTTIVGTLAATNADDTAAASGSVGGDVTGTVAYTNADDTSAATGTTTVTGTVAYTNADDGVAASGWAGIVSGTVNVTNSDDTASASGTVSGGARRHAGFRREQVRKGYIIKDKRYWLTEDELMALVAQQLTDISRKEVKQITQGKPKPISKKVWDLIAPMERLQALEPIEIVQDDDEEDVLMMFI